MNILIVYDSVFGNTERVAREIYESIKESKTVELKKIDQMNKEKLKNIDLLIIGSPTRAFNATKPIADFVKSLESDHTYFKVAVFDTRINHMDIKNKLVRGMIHKGGYASSKLAKVLKNKSISVVEPLEAFYVTESEGPLKEGELDRVREWCKRIIE